jgi:hypothetical protein
VRGCAVGSRGVGGDLAPKQVDTALARSFGIGTAFGEQSLQRLLDRTGLRLTSEARCAPSELVQAGRIGGSRPDR